VHLLWKVANLWSCLNFSSGQVYKLHSPSTRYLASMSTYDSSNPTKGWDFPELSITMQDSPLIKSSGKGESRSADGDADSKCTTVLSNQLSASKMVTSATEKLEINIK